MGSAVGVVLSAGASARFEGGDKLLAPFEGAALVSHAAETLARSVVDATVAVVPEAGQSVAVAVADRVDETVPNPDADAGMSRSIRLGVAATRERSADAAVFLPGDMPCVDPATVNRLVDTYAASADPIVIPTYEGRRGNPVLVGSACFDALGTLTGDVGARALFDTWPTRRVPVEDAGIHRDVDTVEELSRLRQSGCGATRS